MRKIALVVAFLVFGCGPTDASYPPYEAPATVTPGRGEGWVRFERFDLYKTTCYYLVNSYGQPSAAEGHLVCIKDSDQ